MKTLVLFRPTGETELGLIRESGWRMFPPRVPHQPFFYPVLNATYAAQTARDWNTKDGGTGYVVRFEVNAEFIGRYETRTVGASVHQELWIPADELTEFNDNIAGLIELAAVFPPSKSR